MVFAPAGFAEEKSIRSCSISRTPEERVADSDRLTYCKNNELKELTIPQRGRALDHLQFNAKAEDFWPVITIQDWFVKPKRSPSDNASTA